MTRVEVPRQRQASSVSSDRWSGWITFAIVMMLVTGAVNMCQGFVALFKDGYFLSRAGDQLVLTDYTAWGVVMLISGGLLILTGMSLGSGRGWARWLALVVTCLSIVVQIGFLAAYPIWATIIIAFDVFVILALTVHWSEATN